MNRSDRRRIKRVWGNTKAARQLIELDMTLGVLLALQQQYLDIGLSGPYWDQKRHQWYISRVAGKANYTALHVDHLVNLRDIPTSSKGMQSSLSLLSQLCLGGVL